MSGCPNCGHVDKAHRTATGADSGGCDTRGCSCRWSFQHVAGTGDYERCRGLFRSDGGALPRTPNLVVVAEQGPEAVRERQVGGDHYRKHKIQPWDIWQEYGLNAFEGAVLKYLLRRKGNRLEDLKKARHTLDRLIEIEGGPRCGNRFRVS